jgi:hypothetical protein
MRALEEGLAEVKLEQAALQDREPPEPSDKVTAALFPTFVHCWSQGVLSCGMLGICGPALYR